ncbi:MAG: Glu-tRNA(Gln) amidotransferase subunit GatD [Candidatus Poseidoniia archaeon]|uniref:Glutamyl-tRNA(Gln) amidotransferase subunit D n=1 Tax=Marine Group III euryarchaeote TaxID=2173149 RepID=A0A7C7ZEL3_9ARCH|nr:MAG: Glu-tRNA(Gln) amidotransferase GatDE subunit D [Euryarchaeota archaeon]HIG63257.1 Glu-tRNA(Gln) amidotransferase subunit GatD [Marine Group III euryarchaeote]HIL32861.1 Glu-tRNA(Gln) amidotransferase subunit GatD [Candidatus Poseidoniales archaeon]
MPTSAEQFLKAHDARLHDHVRISAGGHSHEGRVMPAHRFSGDHIVVLKLANGYNIGVSCEGAELELLERAPAAPEATAADAPLPSDLPPLTVLGTGGTIASYVDYQTGAVHPAKSAEEIVAAVTSLAGIANIHAEALLSLASEDMRPDDWSAIAKRVSELHAEDGTGVVIGHGTDTMAYTAAALAFQLPALRAPVVLTGSQRSSDRPSSDAHLNLAGAARAALTDLGEVAIAMHASSSDDVVAIWRGTRARKAHSSRRDAFTAPNGGRLGSVGDAVNFDAEYRPVADETRLEAGFDPDVALVWSHPAMTAGDWEAATAGKRGVIVAGTGLGHIGSHLHAAVRATARDAVVAMTTQCLGGSTNLNVYRNGRELGEAEVVEAGDTLPETALVKLMWLLKHRPDSVAAGMGENLAGELGSRRFLD